MRGPGGGHRTVGGARRSFLVCSTRQGALYDCLCVLYVSRVGGRGWGRRLNFSPVVCSLVHACAPTCICMTAVHSARNHPLIFTPTPHSRSFLSYCNPFPARLVNARGVSIPPRHVDAMPSPRDPVLSSVVTSRVHSKSPWAKSTQHSPHSG